MKEKILSDLRKMDKSRFTGKTDMEIYDIICDIFYLEDDEYRIARECSLLFWKEVNGQLKSME